jgi:TRAP-type C4-dicarboxylate transport system permease large subunit
MKRENSLEDVISNKRKIAGRKKAYKERDKTNKYDILCSIWGLIASILTTIGIFGICHISNITNNEYILIIGLPVVFITGMWLGTLIWDKLWDKVIEITENEK